MATSRARLAALVSTVALILAVGASGAAATNGDKPDKAKPVPDTVTEQRLIVTYTCRQSDCMDPIPVTLRNFIRAALGAKIPVVVVTMSDDEKKDLESRPGFAAKDGVTVVKSDAFPGNAFARDPTPFLITFEKEGKRVFGYAVSESHAAFAKDLAAKGLLQGPLFVMPIAIDGGDLQIDAAGNVYVTSSLYERNKSRTKDEVNKVLQEFLGLDPAKIIELANPPGNATGHSDTLVRPLPNGKVVCLDPASFAAGSGNRTALEAIVTALRRALGEANVVLVKLSAEAAAGRSAFGFSYANAWIADKHAVVPSFAGAQDEEGKQADAAALKVYRDALGGGFTVTSSPVHRAVAALGGCLHCLSGMLSPGSAAKMGAQADKSPFVHFNPATGILRMTVDRISTLLRLDGESPFRAGRPDPLRGAWLHVDELRLNRELSSERVFILDGGRVTLTVWNQTVFTADIPRFYVFPSMNPGLLDHFGVLFNVHVDRRFPSPFLRAFRREVLDGTALYADFFMTPAENLAGLSEGFTRPVFAELLAAGITANGALSCELTGDGEIDESDLDTIRQALGTKVERGDPRDPDGNGVLTGRDLAICESRCTASPCGF